MLDHLDRPLGGARRATTAVLVVVALVASALAVAAGPVSPARATVPGTPGTPQPPTPLFTEDFSAQDVSAQAILVTNYQGTPGTTYAPGVSGASSETYAADPGWASIAGCNGLVVNAGGSPPVGWRSECSWGLMQALASGMGQFQGMTAAAAAKNQVVSAYTYGDPGAGTQLRTMSPIPALGGHFYQVSTIFAATNCFAPHPLERLSLIVDGTPHVLGQNLDPCTDPGRTNYGTVSVAPLKSSALKVPSGSPAVGLELYNANGGGGGNDAGFDLPQIMDVTPQLDKAFSPSSIAAGRTSTLTFTITNTNELGVKDGLAFHDDLPSGVTATGVNATTCTNGTVSAAAGAGSVVFSGARLNLNQNSCTVTVQVTSNIPGTYVNGPGNFPDGTAGLDGLNPPADTTLTVAQPASLNITKATTTQALTRVGQVVTYKFTLKNRGPSTLTNVSVTDTQVAPAIQANMSAVRCETTTLAPDASTTCIGSYTVTQADLDHGSLTDTATATGNDPGGNPVTTPETTLTITTSRPSISIQKTTTTLLATQVGQQIPYTFRVTNTGNVTLFGVAVTDTQAPPASQANMSAVTCPDPVLAPGASEDCTGTYTVALADLQNESINDSATATGAPEEGAAVTSDPSTATVVAQRPGSLTIVKSTTTQAMPAVGQQIPYTFLVTNNSTVTVTSVAVNDTVEPPSLQSNLSAVTCPATTLAAGASTTCTATYQVTQADVNNGQASDSARATGRDPQNNLVQSGVSRVVLSAPTSALTVVKSTTSTSVSAVGQQVPYSFTVTNTGNQTLTNVRVADTQVGPSVQANLGPVTCQSLSSPAGTCSGTSTSLAPGQVATFSAVYTVTLADLANGSINDFAAATGTNPAGTDVTSPQSSATVNTSTTPLTMVKSIAEDAYARIGQAVHYTFTVTNNSATTYNSIQIQDTQVAPATPANMSAIICADSSLAPSASTTCTGTYTVTAADITNGTLSDVATASGVDVGGTTVTTAPSSAIVPATQRPALTVTKTSTTSRATAVGQQIPYTFTVLNTGNVSVTAVQVADTQTPPASQANMTPVDCPPGALDPGQSIACTGTYTVTQADLDFGIVRDTAIASATDPTGAAVESPRASLTITTDPALTIVKSSPTATITTIGQQVPYSFLVTNIRNETVSNVQVTDTQLLPSSQSGMSAISCDATTLGAGESTTCHGTYTATAADIAHGFVADSAVAVGTDSSGRVLPPSEPSTVSIPTVPAPALTVDKTSNVAVITAVGQRVTYRFQVTNTGNTVVDGIGVTDTQTAPASQANLSAIACPYPALEPGDSEICTASYTVTAADLANQSVADTAVATGTTPDGTPVESAPDPLSIPAPAEVPALTIVKSSSLAGVSSLHQQVPYTFTVTNNGTTTLTGVSVTDTQQSPAVQANLSSVICSSLANPSASCSGTRVTLAAGQSAVFTANYTTTQPDFDHGRIDDSAVATGTAPGGPVTSAPSTFVLLIDPISPAIAIAKASTTAAVTQVGQQVPYTFTETNTGNVTLGSVNVTDAVAAPSSQAGLSAIVCPATTLAPNASTVCTATYTTTDADLNGVAVADTAVAHGASPSGAIVDSDQDTVSIPVTQTPAVTVVKQTTTAAVTAAGQQVPYTFTVTNTGNVTLSSVTVTDAVTAPSTPADLSAVTCVTVTNPAATCSGTTAALVPGQVATFTATYTATQADIDAGTVADSATAAGTPPRTAANPTPTPVTSTPSTAAVPVTQTTGLTLIKSSPDIATPISQAGQVVRYEFLVRNTGNVTLTDVAVADQVAPPSTPGGLSPIACPATPLPGGAEVTCTGTYTVTQADVDNGSATDTATATAHDAGGATVTSNDDTITVPGTVTPAVTVVKGSATTRIAQVGEQVPYTFTVTNTGNVTVTGVTITDTVTAPSDPAGLIGPTCPTTTLTPGAQVICTATYTVTQADFDHGIVADVATASALPPATPADPDPTPVISPESGLSIPTGTAPALTVVKSSTTTQITQVGQHVPYTFTVTNSGNVTLTGVGVADTVTAPSDPANLTTPECMSLAGPAGTCTGTATDLAPGQVATFTATYTVTQADLDHGTVGDAATATGTDPGGAPLTSDPSPLVIQVDTSPALTVVKQSSTATVTTVGQVVPYTFTVTNTGNVTLSSVGVTDVVTAPSTPADLSPVTCATLTNPAGTCSGTTTALTPGQAASFTATYTVTQADIDAGTLADTATAAGTPPATPTNPAPTPEVSDPSSVAIAVAQTAGLALTKSSPDIGTPITQAGQVVRYQFLVTNTGNVSVSDIRIDDVVAPPSTPANLSAITCPTVPLGAGEQLTCDATYTATQADVDNGSATDTATATGTSAAGTITSNEDTLTVQGQLDPEVGLLKSSPVTLIATVGQQVPYTFTVTNTGNVTLTDFTVGDVLGAASTPSNLSAMTCPDTALIPGQAADCTATYTVTQADMDSGTVDDVATATADPAPSAADPDPAPVVSAPSAVSIRTDFRAALTVAKTSTTTQITRVGQQVPYTFTVTNTGTVDAIGVSVTDTVTAPSDPSNLTGPDCATLSSPDGTCSGPTADLAPGQVATFEATYTVTQADLDNGTLADSATATGTDPNGGPLTSDPSPLTIQVAADPAIQVVKASTTTRISHAGEQVPYTFTVTNTGNVTLTGVQVADTVAAPSRIADLTGPDCPASTLAPGADMICTAGYTVSQADMDNGTVNDSATATGIPPATTADPDPAAVTSPESAVAIPVTQTTGLTVLKASTTTAATMVGQQIAYTFTVTNTGTVTITDLHVTDMVAPPSSPSDLTPVLCPVTVLAPGAHTACTATYTVSAADLANRGVADTATATGTPPGGGSPVTSIGSRLEIAAVPATTHLPTVTG